MLIREKQRVAVSAKTTAYLVPPHCQTSADTQFRLCLPYLNFHPNRAGSDDRELFSTTEGYMNTPKSV
jgi:hypothetical protein